MLGKNRIINFCFLKDVLLLLCFFLSQSPFNQVSTVGGLLGPRPSNELAVVRDPSS